MKKALIVMLVLMAMEVIGILFTVWNIFITTASALLGLLLFMGIFIFLIALWEWAQENK